jgi:hypothetical protein
MNTDFIEPTGHAKHLAESHDSPTPVLAGAIQLHTQNLDGARYMLKRFVEYCHN